MNSALRFNREPELIPVRLFFDQSKDEQFFVLAEVMSPGPSGPIGQLSVLTFEHEDVFLERVGSADLATSDMSLLAASVIRSIGWEPKIQGWLELNFTADQLDSLGLDYSIPRRSDFSDIHEVF